MKILSFIQKNLHQPTEIAWEKKRGSPNDFETTRKNNPISSYFICSTKLFLNHPAKILLDREVNLHKRCHLISITLSLLQCQTFYQELVKGKLVAKFSVIVLVYMDLSEITFQQNNKKQSF